MVSHKASKGYHFAAEWRRPGGAGFSLRFASPLPLQRTPIGRVRTSF
jgi:hypothetical protein